jgi:hypothetical protein
MKTLLIWLVYFPFALAVELLCYATNWFVALFTTTDARYDYVKRLQKHELLERDYLVKLFYLWQTHDNACDEWWYGRYNDDDWWEKARNWTQADYDNSWWIRYYCRVKWLYRNNAYGFLFYWFSTPVEALGTEKIIGIEDSGEFWMHYQQFKHSFKLEAQIPILFTDRFYSLNIGWKAHRSAPLPLKMYANRIIGLRKYD